MAKNAPATTETPAAPTFVAVPLSALPKRELPKGGREFDEATARVLLGIVSVEGQTVSDAQSYTDRKEATKAANRARRLLAHPTIRPDGKDVKTRIYTEDKGKTFRWAAFLAPHKERKPRKSNGAS